MGKIGSLPLTNYHKYEKGEFFLRHRVEKQNPQRPETVKS